MANRCLSVCVLCIVFYVCLQLSAVVAWEEYQQSTNDDNLKESTWYLTNAFRQIGIQAVESWQRAQQYSNFETDWNTLKLQPLNPIVLGSFLSNTTLPAIYRVTASIKRGWIFIYKVVMNFTKRKCDKLIGPDAPTHPWNLIKQNRETVSFVVFVYAVGLGLILMRLCSFWTFISIASGTYAVYTFGGPYLCFRGFVFITGCSWLLLDTILSYPLQSAIVCLALVLGSNILPYFNPMGNSRNYVTEYKQLKGKVDRLDRRFGSLIQRFENLEIQLRHQAADEAAQTSHSR